MPQVVGSHAIEISRDGNSGNGFPLMQTRLVNVYDPSKIQVHLTGVPVVGENNNFVIDTAGAGKGALSVSIKSADGEDPSATVDQHGASFDGAVVREVARLCLHDAVIDDGERAALGRVSAVEGAIVKVDVTAVDVHWPLQCQPSQQ